MSYEANWNRGVGIFTPNFQGMRSAFLRLGFSIAALSYLSILKVLTIWSYFPLKDLMLVKHVTALTLYISVVAGLEMLLPANVGCKTLNPSLSR